MKKVSLNFNDLPKKERDPVYKYLIKKFKYKNIELFEGYIDDNNIPHGACEICIISEKVPELYNFVSFNANHGELIGNCEFEIADDKTEKSIITKFNFLDDNFGEKLYPNGDKYLGSIKDFKENGPGKITYSNKSYVISNFINKQFHGVSYFYNEKNELQDIKVYNNGELLGSSKSQKEIQKILKRNNMLDYESELSEKEEKSNIVEIRKAIKNIEKSIVGQDKAKEVITNNLILSLLCEKREHKPITSMLFTGPTGVGKTEMAKQIAKYLYNGNMYTVDFANFHDSFMVSSLIGSPAGYVGYDKEPDFLKYVADNKDRGGVILFDELDKADTDCYNILMHILDEGEVISAKNEKYDLSNFVILFTTNMTSNYNIRKLGFSDGSNSEKDLKQNLSKAVTGLKKEQLARIDVVAEFTSLSKENNINIIKQSIKDTIKKLKTIKDYNIEISYNNKIIGEILDNAGTEFGVREIKRQTEKIITQKLAEFIKNNSAKHLKVELKNLDDVVIKPITDTEIKKTKNKEKLVLCELEDNISESFNN